MHEYRVDSRVGGGAVAACLGLEDEGEAGLEVVDHRVGLVRGWSSTFAKDTEAALRISLARRNSAISLRSCVSSVR